MKKIQVNKVSLADTVDSGEFHNYFDSVLDHINDKLAEGKERAIEVFAITHDVKVEDVILVEIQGTLGGYFLTLDKTLLDAPIYNNNADEV